MIGINACQIHGDNASGYRKFGVNGGIGLNSRFNDMSSFEFAFLFTQKGARKNQNPDKGDYTFYRVNLNYLEIPVYYQRYVNSKYFITLGGYAAYLLSYSEDTEIGNWNGVYPFNNFDFGVNVGLGRNIDEKITIEVRSGNSFVPARNYGIRANQVFFPNPVARFFNQGLYNNILSIFVVYKIDAFKKKEIPNE